MKCSTLFELIFAFSFVPRFAWIGEINFDDNCFSNGFLSQSFPQNVKFSLVKNIYNVN